MNRVEQEHDLTWDGNSFMSTYKIFKKNNALTNYFQIQRNKTHSKKVLMATKRKIEVEEAPH